MLTALLTLFAIGIVGLVLVSVALALVGVVFGLAFSAVALALKVLPFVLVGWLVVKLLQKNGDRRRLTASDQNWLDS